MSVVVAAATAAVIMAVTRRVGVVMAMPVRMRVAVVMAAVIMIVTPVLMSMAMMMVVAPAAMPVIMSVAGVMMAVIMMVMMVAAAVVHGQPLRAERPLHRRDGAAEAADGFGQGVVSLQVEGVGGGLGPGVGAAGQQRGAQQPRRIFGAHLQHALGGGAHQHEAAVLQFQGVAVAGDDRRRQGDLHLKAVVGGETRRGAAQGAGAMVEGDGGDDALRLHGGAAGQGDGA